MYSMVLLLLHSEAVVRFRQSPSLQDYIASGTLQPNEAIVSGAIGGKYLARGDRAAIIAAHVDIVSGRHLGRSRFVC